MYKLDKSTEETCEPLIVWSSSFSMTFFVGVSLAFTHVNDIKYVKIIPNQSQCNVLKHLYLL